MINSEKVWNIKSPQLWHLPKNNIKNKDPRNGIQAPPWWRLYTTESDGISRWIPLATSEASRPGGLRHSLSVWPPWDSLVVRYCTFPVKTNVAGWKNPSFVDCIYFLLEKGGCSIAMLVYWRVGRNFQFQLCRSMACYLPRNWWYRNWRYTVLCNLWQCFHQKTWFWSQSGARICLLRCYWLWDA